MPAPLEAPPYPLPPLPDPEAVNIRNLDLWEAMEFFHVEALLRSPEIWKAYKKWMRLGVRERALAGDVLSNEYGVENGWAVLDGDHHRHVLRPQEIVDKGGPKVRFSFRSGVLNLTRDLKIKREKMGDGFSWDKVGELILDERPRYLWVRLDAAYPIQRILKELKEELTARLPSVQESSSSYSPRKVTSGLFPDFPYHSQHIPPIRDVAAWLDYFRCYDLRQEGKTFGKVAINVYGNSNQRETAEKAYKRVSKLIGYAERKEWPLVSGFSQ